MDIAKGSRFKSSGKKAIIEGHLFINSFFAPLSWQLLRIDKRNKKSKIHKMLSQTFDFSIWSGIAQCLPFKYIQI